MTKFLIGSSLFILFSIASFVLASPLEKLPADSWVYPVIDQLYTSGLFPQLHRSLRPYSRGQIAEFLIEIRQNESSGALSLSDWQKWQIEKLEYEFQYEIEALNSSSELKNQVKINPEGVFRFNKTKDVPALGRGQFFISGSWEWDNRFVFQTRAVVDNRGEEDPNFLAQEWKKGLTGMFDRGYAGFRAEPFYFTLGRDYLRWGPAGQGLLLSSNSPAMDFLSFEAGSGKFRLSFFTSRLDTINFVDSVLGPQSANRFISGHRLNLKHPAGWEIGFSEIILYGGVDRGMELFYLNPVLPYYVEQYNQNVDDNSLWNLEFALTFWNNKEFYGELLIDDFQYDFVSEPHQLGFTLGARLADLLGWQGSFWNLEYTRVGSFVYGQQKPWNRYTYQDVVLGHVLGSDFDQWRFSLKYLPHKYFTVNLAGSYTRQGEMTADSVYTDPIPKDTPFPSGIVEKVWSGSLGVTFQPDARLIANLNFIYQDFKNYQHLSGQKQESWTILLRLDYNFWKEFRL
jgi:hypothetical protein